MKESYKHCYNCQYYNRYYTKGLKQFNKTEIGYCRRKDDNQLIDSHVSCERFVAKKPSRRSGVLRMRLSEIMTELTSIREILEAEQRDEENVQEL